MANLISGEGQVIIEEQIRERFGVRPGWQTLQVPAEDHVKLYFIPPAHTRSLRGCLAKYARGTATNEHEWDQARQSAWAEAARGEFGLEETSR